MKLSVYLQAASDPRFLRDSAREMNFLFIFNALAGKMHAAGLVDTRPGCRCRVVTLLGVAADGEA
jgi:hypothetical protein